MSGVLSFGAGRKAINIIINSFEAELGKRDRNKLYLIFGKLYPAGSCALSKMGGVERVKAAVENLSEYEDFFGQGREWIKDRPQIRFPVLRKIVGGGDPLNTESTATLPGVSLT